MKRAVILDPGQNTTRLAAFEFAETRGWEVVSVAHNLAAAVGEVADARADVIVVLSRNDLHPLIRVVADGGSDAPVPVSRRRPVRCHHRGGSR